MFKEIMIKGCDKMTHFDNSDNDFCDNVITLSRDNVITKIVITSDTQALWRYLETVLNIAE